MLDKKNIVWVVSDGTHTKSQSLAIAKYLATNNNIYQFNFLGANSSDVSEPDFIIAVGYNSADILLQLKRRFSSCKIAIILDPLKNHDEFDYIILPSYEPYPYKGNNIIRITGLPNFVDQEYLAQQKQNYLEQQRYAYLRELNLAEPFLSIILGGKHTGGDITNDDITQIIKKAAVWQQSTKGTILVTTSFRSNSEMANYVTENLKQHFINKDNFYIYDYNNRRNDNPYGIILSLADNIIVTADSVRMMSEVCSSGKAAYIYKPKSLGFQYHTLVDELISANYAKLLNEHSIDFTTDNPRAILPHLNEAKRIADVLERYSASNIY